MRELLRACYYAIDKKPITDIKLSFKEKELLKIVMKKVKGTDIELLLKESGGLYKVRLRNLKGTVTKVTVPFFVCLFGKNLAERKICVEHESPRIAHIMHTAALTACDRVQLLRIQHSRDYSVKYFVRLVLAVAVRSEY